MAVAYDEEYAVARFEAFRTAMAKPRARDGAGAERGRSIADRIVDELATALASLGAEEKL